MYNEHFELHSNPFSPTPSPEFVYHSGEHEEAIAHFRYALENREAFMLLTGEVGTGKTTAVQAVMRLLPEGTPVALVNNTTLEPRELLEEIAIRFGLDTKEGETKPSLLRRMESYFESMWAEGKQALLILDEAHLLGIPVLEEVRLLSNLERQGGKLLQICLVGQPELVGHLQRNELRQLRQRISVRYALRPLRPGESRKYLEHRLAAAGSSRPERVFTTESADMIYRLTNGIPREINVVAGQAMLNAFVDGKKIVSANHVRSVVRDYGFEGLRPSTIRVDGQAKPDGTAIQPPGSIKLRDSEARKPEPAGPPPAPTLKETSNPDPIPLPPKHLRPEPAARPVTEGSAVSEESPAPSPKPQVVPAPKEQARPASELVATPKVNLPAEPRKTPTQAEPTSKTVQATETQEEKAPKKQISMNAGPHPYSRMHRENRGSSVLRYGGWILAIAVIVAAFYFMRERPIEESTPPNPATSTQSTPEDTP